MRIRNLGAVVLFVSMPLAFGFGQGIRAQERVSPDGRAEAYRLFMHGRHLEGTGDVDGAIRAYRDAADIDSATGEILGELAALYARRNDTEAATLAATQALERDSDNRTANRILGLVLASKGRGSGGSDNNTARAIEHLDKARGTLLPDLQVELTLARLYLIAEESTKAIGVLETLLEAEPGLTDAGLLLSQAYQRDGRTEEAVTMLEGIVGVGRPSSRALRRLGELYGQLDRWSDAVGAYELAAARNPRSSDIQRDLANAFLQNGQAERARDVLQGLSESRPDDVALLYQLSQVQVDLGEFDAAEVTARRLVEVEPNGIRGPYALAEVYARRHDYRAVIDTLEPAVDLQGQAQAAPDGAVTRQARARPYQVASLLGRIGFAYQQLQEQEGAIQAYRYAVDLLPMSLEYGARLVQAYLNADRVNEARNALDALRPYHPGVLTVARLEAQLLGDGGDVGGGTEVLQEALAQNDRDPAAHLALASFYRDHERFDAAVGVLQAAEARFPDNVSVLFQLGAVLEQSRQFTDAEGAFRRLLDRDPGHAATLNYLGYMLADRGDRLEESVGLLRRAIEIDPHNGAYLDSLGWAYFKLVRFDLAEPHLRQASQQMVWNSVIQDHLGDLMFALGRFDEAIVAWEAALAGDRESVDSSAIDRKIREARQSLGR